MFSVFLKNFIFSDIHKVAVIDWINASIPGLADFGKIIRPTNFNIVFLDSYKPLSAEMCLYSDLIN